MNWFRSKIDVRAVSNCAFLPALLVLALAAPMAYGEQGFLDPLDHPASPQSTLAERSMMAIAKAGTRFVAVGSRGLIVYSDDSGKTWLQSKVPVQSDLLAVNFPTAQDGWAVGHDGVILNSRDGGKTWAKQFDGRMAAESFKKFYANAGTDSALQAAATQVAQNFKAGPTLPFLSVWFESATKGFAVGSFGMLVGTLDGGKTWQPWLHLIDNEHILNLNSIRGVGQNIFIVGEGGMVYVLDRAKNYFRSISTGYGGSFFGVAGNDKAILTYGLRGVAYRSTDDGKHWTALKMPAQSTLTCAIEKPDATGFILANSAGQLFSTDAQMAEFTVRHSAQPMRYTDLAIGDSGALVMSGIEGLRTERLVNTETHNLTNP